MRPEDMLSLSATITRLMHLFALDSGERIFAIDETRVLREARAPLDQGQTPTSISIVPLQGALRARGGTGSMASFADRVTQAAGNSDVGAIVLDVDSPGGTYAGTPEAAAVAAAAQAKPVIAMVDSLAASAAYWIASQATQIVVSPSAEVGSIGVISMHVEISKALADAGVTPTIMRSVPNKATGNMFEPLTEDTKAKIMADIADAHAEFTRGVAKGRKTSAATVDSGFGQGFTVGAQQAVRSGMADKIGTMSDVLAGLRTKSGTIRRRSAFAF